LIRISSLRPEQISEVKHLIYSVVHAVFHEHPTLEESIAYYESIAKLRDVEEFQRAYLENGGVFLVLSEDGRLLGTGALRLLEGGVGEIKRLWLLPEYHGQGLGYRLMRALLDAARERGCTRVRLETEGDPQTRAYRFYKKMGFSEIPRYGEDPHAVAMERGVD